MEKLNKDKVYLGFYKAKNPVQKFKAKYFGLHFASMILYINGCVYTFRHWESKMQKEPIWNLSNYVMINTEFDCLKLSEAWEETLLNQKARDWDSLFLRHRCIKSTKFILNQLGKKWQYRFGDMFVNNYFRRRIR